MVKTKKAEKAPGALALTAALSAGVASCSIDLGGFTGQVSDEEWEKLLNMNWEAEENFTLTQVSGSSYAKEEAATYGEWQQQTATYYVNNETNTLVGSVSTTTWVDNEILTIDDEETFVAAHFETYTYTNYYFTKDGKYYCATCDTYAGYPDRENETSWSGHEITLAYFTETMETMLNLSAAFSTYSSPAMKQAFTYDEEKESYVMMSMGSQSVSLKFLENNGLQLDVQSTSIYKVTTTIFDVGTTVVTIPSQAYDACEEFEIPSAQYTFSSCSCSGLGGLDSSIFEEAFAGSKAYFENGKFVWELANGQKASMDYTVNGKVVYVDYSSAVTEGVDHPIEDESSRAAAAESEYEELPGEGVADSPDIEITVTVNDTMLAMTLKITEQDAWVELLLIFTA